MKSKSILFLFVVFTLAGEAQRLVLPGDYPDPSAVKIGDTYWGSATTSNWAPAYPLLKSKDLINWQTAGVIFNQLPQWADYYFWAPEMTYDNGKVYVYYAAHKKGGNLCVGVASADRPEGPYRDHGPLICQEVGSIDAFPMRDENGKLYMIWKEDANSVGKPTPIWIQAMNEERTALTGEKKELFRNNEPWEGNLVEGVSMIKKNGYYYAFYAAAACCGRGCNYVTGIARSRSLFGPWEKYNKNPVLTHEGSWKCPGHGTPVEKDGKYYFLYHAYDTASNVYVGRQGLLAEFRFTPDGWIEFIEDRTQPAVAIPSIDERFKERTLSHHWQWSVFQNMDKQVKRRRLQLGALPTPSGAFLGQKTYGLNYEATAIVDNRRSGSAAGIALIGDERNMVSALISKDSIKVVQLKDNKDSIVYAHALDPKKKTHLRMQVRNGKDILFLYSRNGRDFIPLNSSPVNGYYLPPWDRALRVGVVAKGNEPQKGVFKRFAVNYQ